VALNPYLLINYLYICLVNKNHIAYCIFVALNPYLLINYLYICLVNKNHIAYCIYGF